MQIKINKKYIHTQLFENQYFKSMKYQYFLECKFFLKISSKK